VTADSNFYEHYLTQSIADAEMLKEDMLANSQEVSQAILNISEMSDAFGNNYGNYAAGGNINVPPYSLYPVGGSGGNYSIIYPSGVAGGGGGNVVTDWGMYSSQSEPPEPPVDTEALIEKMVTRYAPGSPLVICADNELTAAQMNEISQSLTRHNIEAVIIRGARAGTGRGHPRPVREECKRIDILAQLAETWERHPDLTFAELIRWWSGENMADDDFAAATDVYARKVYE
jgi:hypothetical protein